MLGSRNGPWKLQLTYCHPSLCSLPSKPEVLRSKCLQYVLNIVFACDRLLMASLQNDDVEDLQPTPTAGKRSLD